jgi:dihydroorotase-like cyclic amidohydrolase
MDPFDTIIRGGTVATASDTFTCDIGIRAGRVAALALDLGGAAEVIDATASSSCRAASTATCTSRSLPGPTS